MRLDASFRRVPVAPNHHIWRSTSLAAKLAHDSGMNKEQARRAAKKAGKIAMTTGGFAWMLLEELGRTKSRGYSSLVQHSVKHPVRTAATAGRLAAGDPTALID